MKKIICYILIALLILSMILYMSKDFVLKEILERKLSSVNGAPVKIENVSLDFRNNFITLENIHINSRIDKEKEFIKIKELKAGYYINLREKLIIFDETEINGIVFFEKENLDINDGGIADNFENRVTKAEEEFKKDQVINEIKDLYTKKVNLDTSTITRLLEIKKEKYKGIEKIVEEKKSDSNYKEIKESLKNIKENGKNISLILDEIAKIGKNTKNIFSQSEKDEIRKNIEELKNNGELEEDLKEVIREFLNSNRFIFKDLDAYINLYLNTMYEEKVYNIVKKYRSILEEIRRRKIDDSKLDDKNTWELYFNSISLTFNSYGISFNGEIRNFSSRISKNKKNIPIKLFGEKADTIGELRGYVNLDSEITESKINIPRATLKDFSSEITKSGEAFVYQYLKTNSNDLVVEGHVVLKDLKLNVEKFLEKLKVEDDFTRDILSSVLLEISSGDIKYSYDTLERKLTVETNISETLENSINRDNSLLKIKLGEKIKKEYLKKILK